MKKLTLAFLLFSVSISCIKAQDLIVTTNGDSIDAQILRITDQYVFIKESRDRGPEGRVLERAQILGYIPNFSSKDYPETYEPIHELNLSGKPKLQSFWKTGISGGYSYQLGAIEDGLSPFMESQVRELKHGFNITLDFHRSRIGTESAGFKASWFRSQMNSEFSFLNVVTNIFYAGPSAILFLNQSEIPAQGFFIDASIGILYIRQHLTETPENFATGNSVGGQIGIGVEVPMVNHTSLFIKASLFAGSVRTINVHTDNRSYLLHTNWADRFSLSRIDLVCGIRF